MTAAPDRGDPGEGFAGRPGLALVRGEGGEERGAHVWLHAASAAGHDFHAGAGDFAARSAEIRRGTAVSTALTRSNLACLAAMPGWLAGRGVTAWRIVVPRTTAPIDGVTPRLAVGLPYALRAIALGQRVGVAGWISGAPHCLLGPFRGASTDGERRAYAPGCEGCPARAACPGVDAGYLARFGDAELSARALRPATAPPAGGAAFPAGDVMLAWSRMASGTGAEGQVGMDRGFGTGRKGQVDRPHGTGAEGHGGMDRGLATGSEGQVDRTPGTGAVGQDGMDRGFGASRSGQVDRAPGTGAGGQDGMDRGLGAGREGQVDRAPGTGAGGQDGMDRGLGTGREGQVDRAPGTGLGGQVPGDRAPGTGQGDG